MNQSVVDRTPANGKERPLKHRVILVVIALLALAPPASAQRIYSEGWGVVDQNGISMKSVSETRRAALINWLAATNRAYITGIITDDALNALWEERRGDALVKRVRIYIAD
jgi:hypothetical protein